MLQSFFDSPEISSIFKRKDTDKKLSASVNARYEIKCAECLRLRECKQLRKRDRNSKKGKSRTQYQHTVANRSERSRKVKSNMEDVEKIAMMNEDNVYYDYDEEKGVVVEKKHSVVMPYNVVSKRKSQRNRKEGTFDLSSRLEDKIRTGFAEEEFIEEQCMDKSCSEAGTCREEQFHAYPDKECHEGLCPDEKFHPDSCPNEKYTAGSCPDDQFHAGSCTEELYLDGSCPSDSAYDTTHDELTESLDRLTLVDDKFILEERASRNASEEQATRFTEEFIKFKPASKQESPYRRCRSKAICGRNCKLCRGSNTNIIQTGEPKTLGHAEKQEDKNLVEFKIGKNEESHSWKDHRDGDGGNVVCDSSETERSKHEILEENTKMKIGFDDARSKYYTTPAIYTSQYDSDPDNEYEDASQYNIEQASQMFYSGPHLVMLYDFKAENEDDVTVHKGDIVLLLDNRDRDWVWVMTNEFEEGYVPKSLTMQHHMGDCEECALEDLQQQQKQTLQASKSNTSSTSSKSNSEKEASVIKHGIKMIAISNFESIEKGKLCVVKGEEIVIDIKNQQIPEWLWAYSPRTRAYGYIPEHLVDALEVSSV